LRKRGKESSKESPQAGWFGAIDRNGAKMPPALNQDDEGIIPRSKVNGGVFWKMNTSQALRVSAIRLVQKANSDPEYVSNPNSTK